MPAIGTCIDTDGLTKRTGQRDITSQFQSVAVRLRAVGGHIAAQLGSATSISDQRTQVYSASKRGLAGGVDGQAGSAADTAAERDIACRRTAQHDRPTQRNGIAIGLASRCSHIAAQLCSTGCIGGQRSKGFSPTYDAGEGGGSRGIDGQTICAIDGGVEVDGTCRLAVQKRRPRQVNRTAVALHASGGDVRRQRYSHCIGDIQRRQRC